MKNLTEAINKINMEMDKYFFKNLSEREKIDFKRLLDAREILQNIIYSQIDINEYINKVYTDKKDALEALYFLNRYAGLNVSMKILSKNNIIIIIKSVLNDAEKASIL